MNTTRTKLSNKRLVVSGDVFELYEYQLPYSYNFAPLRQSCSRVASEAKRRGDNLWRTRQQIRRLVDANVKRFGFEPVFLTFTFAENVTDVDTANAHFHDFVRRLNYHYRKSFEYLAVVEVQRRGAVHYHCIFFNMELAIEEDERQTRAVATIWGHGFVDIERVRSARKVGPYVCKYLDKAVHDPRLKGKKAFFTSRGLLRPQVFRDVLRIDTILSMSKLKEEHKVEYASDHYKRVIYTTYARCHSSL